MSPEQTHPLIPVRLVRVVLREDSDQQWIFLEEQDGGPGGSRGFPIVIGTGEAGEIHRVLTGSATTRPMTHQLMASTIEALGSKLIGVDIVDLRANTFYAQLRLSVPPGGDGAGLAGGSSDEILVDARPSDALAIALRTGAKLRVAESVLEQVRTDQATDTLPPQAGIQDVDPMGGLSIEMLHDESATLFEDESTDDAGETGGHPGDGNDDEPTGDASSDS